MHALSSQFHCMEMCWSRLLALVLLTYFCFSMMFMGVFLLLAVRCSLACRLASQCGCSAKLGDDALNACACAFTPLQHAVRRYLSKDQQ